jgi:hypothetical protein
MQNTTIRNTFKVEDISLLGYYTVTGQIVSEFLRIIVPPTSGSSSPRSPAWAKRVHYMGIGDEGIARTEQVVRQLQWY